MHVNCQHINDVEHMLSGIRKMCSHTTVCKMWTDSTALTNPGEPDMTIPLPHPLDIEIYIYIKLKIQYILRIKIVIFQAKATWA